MTSDVLLPAPRPACRPPPRRRPRCRPGLEEAAEATAHHRVVVDKEDPDAGRRIGHGRRIPRAVGGMTQARTCRSSRESASCAAVGRHRATADSSMSAGDRWSPSIGADPTRKEVPGARHRPLRRRCVLPAAAHPPDAPGAGARPAASTPRSQPARRPARAVGCGREPAARSGASQLPSLTNSRSPSGLPAYPRPAQRPSTRHGSCSEAPRCHSTLMRSSTPARSRIVVAEVAAAESPSGAGLARSSCSRSTC